MAKTFGGKAKTALEARGEAQKITFWPIAFQAARVMRDNGILVALEQSDDGLTLEEIAQITGVPIYGARVLLEAGAHIDLVEAEPGSGRFRLTKTGYFLLNDQMTRVNMDFVGDVCYRGMDRLDEAIATGKPAGLKEFGDWPTVYEGLAELPEKVQTSWFAFDHFYSDAAFPTVLPIIFEREPANVLDIGGNTGKFAIQCVRYNPDVQVAIVDLPGQLEQARRNVVQAGFDGRVEGVPLNLLDHREPLPQGYDVLWMSQFLDCFSEDEIASLLSRAAAAMDENATLYIMETYWNRQQYDVASYCLVNTSLYFTCIANGNSRMYHSDDMIKQVENAGLKVVFDRDNIGLGHTLFGVRRA